MFRLCGSLLLLAVIFHSSPLNADTTNPLELRVGIGYDFITQEYFLDSTLYSPEPGLTSAMLKKEYLDDKKGLIHLRYKPPGKSKLILETGWEQTPDLYRALGRGFWGLTSPRQSLEADFNFEAKQRCHGAAEAGEELAMLDGNLKYRQKLGERLETELRVSGESVSFDSTGGVVFDYSRVAAEMGLEYLTEGLNSIYLKGRIEHRRVPDSSRLDYQGFKSSLGYLGEPFGCPLVAEGSLEFRNLNQEINRGDYFLYSLDADARIPLGKEFFLEPNLNLERFDYRSDDYSETDYLLARLGIDGGREYSQWSPFIGPRFEFLSTGGDFQEEDYFEYSISAGCDIYTGEGFLLSIENQFGKRGYLKKSAYLSDFTLNRLTLIGDSKIWANITLSLLFSGEWEWHGLESDNTRLYLLSSTLSFTF